MGPVIWSWLSSVLFALIIGLSADAIPSICKYVVQYAAKRMETRTEEHLSDWLANLDTFDSKFGRLYWAIQVLLASFVLEPPFADRSKIALLFLKVRHQKAIVSMHSLIIQTALAPRMSIFARRRFIARLICESIASIEPAFESYVKTRAVLYFARRRHGEAALTEAELAREAIRIISEVRYSDQEVLQFLKKYPEGVMQARELRKKRWSER